MKDGLLEHFAEELRALRGRAARFAETHPKIAGRLRLEGGTADDPHVERIVQSVAFVAAGLRQKLEDDYPELTGALLETLYPNYLAPVPAMTMVAFRPAPGLDSVQEAPRGTVLTAGPVSGEPIRFSTTQAVALAPIALTEARLMNRPFEAPPAPPGVAGCLRLKIERSGKARLTDLDLPRLRLWIAAPQNDAEALMALLLQGVGGVAVARHAADEDARRLPPEAIRQVGFDPEDALVPTPEGALDGYRILAERFVLPERNLFIEIDLPPLPDPDRAEIFVWTTRAPGSLERRIDARSLALHATPAVNLFPARAEPVVLDGTRPDYPLTVDARRAEARRVHSITSVTLSEGGGPTRPSRPYFHRLTERGAGGVFHQLRRRPETADMPAGETAIAFVDGRAAAARSPDTVASIAILATNGDLPLRLPFGGGQPVLTLGSAVEGAAGATCLTAPTAPRRVDTGGERSWRLISHLAQNHLTLAREGAEALRGLLRLYDPGDDRMSAQTVAAVKDVATTPAIARLRGVTVVGTDVRITFDPDAISEVRAVVFGSVLDRFLGVHAAINSFTRLAVRMEGRTDDLAAFPPRAGQEALL